MRKGIVQVHRPHIVYEDKRDEAVAWLLVERLCNSLEALASTREPYGMVSAEDVKQTANAIVNDVTPVFARTPPAIPQVTLWLAGLLAPYVLPFIEAEETIKTDLERYGQPPEVEGQN